MPYPASSYPEGVDLTIIAGNQLHQVINGEANEVVSTTSGDIPSVRKALADSMMFKVPVDWVQGEVTTDPLETRLYNGQPYWAPEATLANPITLGASPVATTDWLLAPQGYRNEYNLGKYQAGILISDSQEYVVYDGKSYFAVSPPYTTTSTAPDNDANMFEGNYITSDFGTVVSGTEVKLRRGTDAEILAGTPAIGELWFNTTDNSIHMGDGVTLGGIKHINRNTLPNYTNLVFDSVQELLANPSETAVGNVISINNLEMARASGDGSSIAHFDVKSAYPVEAFAGANAGEKIAAALQVIPDSGGVIDARSLTGVQLIASDIFAGITKPFTLLTGVATYQVDISSYSLTLSSHQKVILHGTRFEPLVFGSDGWQSNTGLFRTDTIQTTGSVAASSNQLVVADTTGIEVGCLVAIDGAAGTDNNEEATLTASINSTTTTIPLDDITTLPSTYTVIINGEVITGNQRSGNDLINVTRGSLGTTAASHTNGDTASMIPYYRALVEKIDGNTITLSGTASVGVVNATVLVGSTDVAVDGIGTIDGRQNRDGADPSGNSFGIKFYFATRSVVGEKLKLHNWDHGGAYLESSWYNFVQGDYTGNSRPAGTTGANIWVFRNSSFNVIKPSRVSDSYLGIFVDDRTSNANLRDGPCNKNLIIAPTIASDEICLEISGGNDNTYYIGNATANVPLRILTNVQGSNPRACRNNTGHAGSVGGIAASCVLRDNNNVLFIGSSDVVPDVGGSSKCTIDLGGAQGEYFGSSLTNVKKMMNYFDNGGIRLFSKNTSVTTDQEIGRFEVYGSDGSGPGSGVKGAISIQGGNPTASNYQMKFIVSVGGENDKEVLAIDAAGNFIPMDDNTRNLGAGSRRWNTVYAGTGTINTSDENMKQDILNIDEVETKTALECKALFKKFRFKDAVEHKGDEARIHFGVIAQEIEQVFASNDLSADDYGLFCRDSWYELDGEIIQPDDDDKYYIKKVYEDHTSELIELKESEMTKHTRLGIRYEELLCFIISAI